MLNLNITFIYVFEEMKGSINKKKEYLHGILKLIYIFIIYVYFFEQKILPTKLLIFNFKYKRP